MSAALQTGRHCMLQLTKYLDTKSSHGPQPETNLLPLPKVYTYILCLSTYLPPLRLTKRHQNVIVLPADAPGHEARLEQLGALLEDLLRRSTDVADVAHVAAHGMALAHEVSDDFVVTGPVEVDECRVRVGGGGGGC